VLRESVRFDVGQVRLVPALRGALGVVLPLAIGVVVGQTAIGLGIAIGVLNVAFCDQPGAYRLRAWRMLLASVFGGFSVLVGAATGAVDVLAVLLTAVWGLAAGMVVAFGPATMQVGLTCLALLIVFSGHPMSFRDALGEGLLVFVGGLL
jgi:hypothetical protein